jgi:hypothetical protein
VKSTVDLRDARWHKSSRSGTGTNSNCVEVAGLDARWRKSSRSGNGTNSNCVEVAFTGPAAGVRDSKNPAGRVLVLPATAWTSFVSSR